MSKISVLVVDDEPLAREGIVTLLGVDPEIEIVGTCGDGVSAVEAIRTLRPDLIFLDVQMPKRDGFEVLMELKPAERPLVIFITAYDQYAVQAFEQCAFDYLLKPFRDTRFALVLARAKDEVRRGRTVEVARQIEQLLSKVRELAPAGSAQAVPPGGKPGGGPETADRIVLKSGTDLHFTRAADIIWIESQGDFVKVHSIGQSQLVRETMHAMEERLDPDKFLRIHRSYLVNLDHVKKVTPALYGDYSVLMSDGSKLRLSRKNRRQLKHLILPSPGK